MSEDHDGIDCDRCGTYIRDTEQDPICVAWCDATVCSRCYTDFTHGRPWDPDDADESEWRRN